MHGAGKGEVDIQRVEDFGLELQTVVARGKSLSS